MKATSRATFPTSDPESDEVGDTCSRIRLNGRP
jgi:hypothetical protein